VVAELLFEEFAVDEGRLTRARSGIVRRETLADHARGIGLGDHVKLGRGEEGSGGRGKDSILADVFEALIGAIYRDGGLDEARRFIGETLADVLHQRGQDGDIHSPRDARTLLQELLQRQGRGTPRYRIISSEGPPHDPTWTLEVVVGGDGLSTGTGRSKQEAARQAARSALLLLDEQAACAEGLVGVGGGG
jgi:ribonuclease-3